MACQRFYFFCVSGTQCLSCFGPELEPYLPLEQLKETYLFITVRLLERFLFLVCSILKSSGFWSVYPRTKFYFIFFVHENIIIYIFVTLACSLVILLLLVPCSYRVWLVNLLWTSLVGIPSFPCGKLELRKDCGDILCCWTIFLCPYLNVH